MTGFSNDYKIFNIYQGKQNLFFGGYIDWFKWHGMTHIQSVTENAEEIVGSFYPQPRNT